ncbi:MAG: hypothetical protein JWN04_3696 [Myxococcaceae bacterium]|nr:hypothetical protein [Myxococcaceae bacterium]
MRFSPRLALSFVAALAACAADESGDTSLPNLRALVAQPAANEGTLEEDFSYPEAEKYRASGIDLKKGDGNLLVVDCKDPKVVAPDAVVLKVETIKSTFCFSLHGSSGYLTLELPNVFLITTMSRPAQATVMSNGQRRVIDLKEPGKSTSIGLEQGANGASLVELRVYS